MTVLIQASDEQLTRSVTDNIHAIFHAVVKLIPGSELQETARYSRHFTGLPNPTFNGIWNTCIHPAELDDVIEENLAWFKARHVEKAMWWFTMDTPHIRETLEAHGFTGNPGGHPGMAADLHQLNEELRMPENFTVVRVTDEKMAETWRDVLHVGFDVPFPVAQSWIDATLAAGFDHAPWRLYLGYLNGQPVATNMMIYGGGVAGLYSVSTLPEARGKGVGAAITLQPLLEARDEGYHYGVLFASKLGYPVYKRLGFRHMNDLGRYIWTNQEGDK